MNFAQQHRSPTKHLAGIASVILFHIILVYALLNGLAVKVVAIIQQPLETKIIEEVKTPPPPEVKVAPPPKFDAPPPPFVPPPEIQVQAAPAQNVIVASTATPPPVEAPVNVTAAPVSAAPPAIARVELVCVNYAAVQAEAGRRYFKELDRDNSLKGDVQIELTVGETGDVKDVVVRKTTSATLTRIAMAATQQLKCNAQTRETRAATAFVFRQQ